jgi:uncharacterized MnhB-related membrane protein
MHLEFNDAKVLLANIFCFLIVEIAAFNAILQSLMLGATIAYTVLRVMNEYKKYKGNE